MTAVRASMSVPLSDPRPLQGGIQADILAQKHPARKVKPPHRGGRPDYLLTRSTEAGERPPDEGSAARKSKR
jgi:hypothetical protein